MLSTFTSYKLITNHLDRSLAVKAAEKPVALEANYYLQHIGSIHSIDEFLKDTRAFRFAMKAFGLEDLDYAKGLMRKVLTGGVADPKAYAKKFLGKYEHRHLTGGIGHNLPQEAPLAFAQAVLDVAKLGK